MLNFNNQPLKGVVTINKISTGQIYTNINFNMDIVHESFTKYCISKDIKDKYKYSGLYSIFQTLMTLDKRLDEVESLISHNRKKLNIQDNMYESIINAMFMRACNNHIKYVKANQASSTALEIEKIIIDNYNKTIEILNKASSELLNALIQKCVTFNSEKWKMFIHLVSDKKEKPSKELSSKHCESVRYLLNNTNDNTLIDELYFSGILVGKSIDFPTKNRYIVVTEMEKEIIEYLDKDELRYIITLLKTSSIKYRLITGNLSESEDFMIVKQYIFEVPASVLDMINCILPLYTDSSIFSMHENYTSAAKDVRRLIEKF